MPEDHTNEFGSPLRMELTQGVSLENQRRGKTGGGGGMGIRETRRLSIVLSGLTQHMVDGAHGEGEAGGQGGSGLAVLVSQRQGLSDRHGNGARHGESLPWVEKGKGRARGEKSTKKIVSAKPHGQISCKTWCPVTGGAWRLCTASCTVFAQQCAQQVAQY